MKTPLADVPSPVYKRQRLRSLQSVIYGNKGEPKRTGGATPFSLQYAGIAQLVEYTTDNRVVTGSSPVACTRVLGVGR